MTPASTSFLSTPLAISEGRAENATLIPRLTIVSTKFGVSVSSMVKFGNLGLPPSSRHSSRDNFFPAVALLPATAVISNIG